MLGLPSILSLFRNEFNKFNNTSVRMLDSIYHMTLRLLEIPHHMIRLDISCASSSKCCTKKTSLISNENEIDPQSW